MIDRGRGVMRVVMPLWRKGREMRGWGEEEMVETEKKDVKKEALGKAARKLQHVPLILLVIFIAAFALYAPPEYGVFILVGVLAVVAFVRTRKKKREEA